MRIGRAWESRHFHDTLTVVVSYGITILAVKLRGSPSVPMDGAPSSPWGVLGILALFTATHGIGASAFYAFFLRGVARHGPGIGGAIGCFVYVHMGLWYGGPTAVLAALTLSPAPVLALLHILLCRGTRLWRALAYGSAFFSILLLVVVTGGLRPETPFWLFAAAVGYQVVLLRLQSRFLARFFLPPPPEPRALPGK